MAKTRMYILVRERIPTGFAAVSIAHASLACYLRYENDQHMQKWKVDSFRKCVCLVTDEQFQAAKAVKANIMISESAFGNAEIALAFCPRPSKKWPREFSTFRLFDVPFKDGDYVKLRDRASCPRLGFDEVIGTVVDIDGPAKCPARVRVAWHKTEHCLWYAANELKLCYPDPAHFELPALSGVTVQDMETYLARPAASWSESEVEGV